jgi:hypothetical protein
MALLKKFIRLLGIKEKHTLVEKEISPILKAIDEHKLEDVEKLLQANSSLIFEKSDMKENLLFYALRERAVDIAIYLDIFNFSLAKQTDNHSNNVLHIACMKNEDKAVYHLMQRHPELIHQKNSQNHYPDDMTTHYSLYQKLHQQRMGFKNDSEMSLKNEQPKKFDGMIDSIMEFEKVVENKIKENLPKVAKKMHY